jgi:outer membrane receptor for ferrienterochelin and colicins
MSVPLWRLALRLSLSLVVWLAGAAALAQSAAPPARAASAAEPPAAPASAARQRIEVTGGRVGDEEQRRRSTAAKIVIGRDELERMGDSNTLEILKRLPGITVPGPGGRGGNPRMRGMAGGYTQILLDGERIPPGFSLDSIPPEQIERIEILRAPTAETGARAIAGTINIVLREGYRKKSNDVNLALQDENGLVSPNVAWTRNDTFGDWIVNASLSLFERRQHNQSTGERTDTDLATGAALLERTSTSQSDEHRLGVHASARIQWRDEAGTSLMLMPLLIASDGRTHSLSTITQTLGTDVPDYASSDSTSDGRFTLARINANVNHRVGDVRLEWRAGFGSSHWHSDQASLQHDASGALTRRIDDDTDTRDRNASVGLKASTLVGQGHSLVGGLEAERNRREQGRTTLWDGVPQLTDFGDVLTASSDRFALYAQDEWSLNPQWAFHAGLRTEGITTRGEGEAGRVDTNASRVTTPLLHAVWKPDPSRRDQLRASLTRSYRSPDLGQLIGRPSLNRVDSPPGPNSALTADSAGNPQLKPEVALGLDIAFERYLADGGVLSVNLFQRRIADLIRNVVALEDVSWSPGQPRYVSRPQNIGNALSRGVELEAKFRLDQAVDAAPPVEVRSNVSIFRSRVDAVPGPDNRLAEQPGGTLNLGADYRLRGTPLTIGGNVNRTPGYTIRLDTDRWMVQSGKTVVDAYALWTFSPDAKLRLSVGNALAQDYLTTTLADSGGVRERSASSSRSYVATQLRLELKL